MGLVLAVCPTLQLSFQGQPSSGSATNRKGEMCQMHSFTLFPSSGSEGGNIWRDTSAGEDGVCLCRDLINDARVKSVQTSPVQLAWEKAWRKLVQRNGHNF